MAIMASEAGDFCHSWKSTLVFLVTVAKVTVTCFFGDSVVFGSPCTSSPLSAVSPAISSLLSRDTFMLVFRREASGQSEFTC